MIHIVTKEVNRVYKLFIEKNPDFLLNKGHVSILAHSLGVSIVIIMGIEDTSNIPKLNIVLISIRHTLCPTTYPSTIIQRNECSRDYGKKDRYLGFPGQKLLFSRISTGYDYDLKRT